MNDVKSETPSETVQTNATTGVGKTVASTLGEIVWLMSQSMEHKALSIGDLEHSIMPAILLRQFRLFYEKQQPVGAVIYAHVSAEMNIKLARMTGHLRLDLMDWQSGTEIYVVDVIAPFGAAQQFVDETIALLQGAPSLKASPTTGNC